MTSYQRHRHRMHLITTENRHCVYNQSLLLYVSGRIMFQDFSITRIRNDLLYVALNVRTLL